LIAELRVNGVFQLIEKHSGNTLIEFKGNKIAALNFPFQHTLVIAAENMLKIISGASGTKKTIEPLVAIEGLNELLLFPPHPFENSILLPVKNKHEEKWILHINLDGIIVGKTNAI
jgi:hypothetical protein